MNIFQWLFQYLVYDPQLNLLQLFFNITGDIGVSIILLALVVNLLMWPIFASSFINSQKIRILQPKLKEIQEKFKDDPQEQLRQNMAFNKKHGVNGSSIFLVLFAQLFFASGLYFVINDVTKGTDLISHLYPFTANLPKTQFSSTAFGFVPVKASTSSYIWLPLLNAFFSFLYGMYSFRWSPQPAIPVTQKPKNKDGETPGLDPEALQKSMEFNTIYVMPVFLFMVNYSFPAGINIYFTTVSLLSLIRQVFITKYYSGHADKLLEEISKSDPDSNDNIKGNNIDSKADALDIMSEAIPVEVVGKKKPSVKAKKSLKKKKT